MRLLSASSWQFLLPLKRGQRREVWLFAVSGLLTRCAREPKAPGQATRAPTAAQPEDPEPTKPTGRKPEFVVFASDMQLISRPQGDVTIQTDGSNKELKPEQFRALMALVERRKWFLGDLSSACVPQTASFGGGFHSTRLFRIRMEQSRQTPTLWKLLAICRQTASRFVKLSVDPCACARRWASASDAQQEGACAMKTIFIFSDSRPTDDFGAVTAFGEDGLCVARIRFDAFSQPHWQFAIGVEHSLRKDALIVMTTTQESSIAVLPVESIRRSPTNRRKRFSASAHAGMAASVRKHGVMQPVLLHPWPEEPGLFGLVCNEHRYRAAEAAQISDFPALVKDLSDDEVLHIQIIENLERKDLLPSEKADGYKDLADRDYTLEQIAEKVSQTRSYFAPRLKLCSLHASSRKLFSDDLLNAKTALIVARLPIEPQDQAAKEITAKRWKGEPMFVREVSEHVQHHYVLRLGKMPIKISDAELMYGAGGCRPRRERTDNQTDLFGDVKSQDICTDLGRYKKRAEAEATGRTVIAGKQANQVKPHEYGQITSGWVDLYEHGYDDRRPCTYLQIPGPQGVKAAALLEDPHSRKLVAVMRKPDLKKPLAYRRSQARSAGAARSSQSAKNATKKAADAHREELFRQGRAKHEGTGLGDLDLKIVAVTFYRRLWGEKPARITKLYDWGPKALSEADAAKKSEFEEDDPEVLGRLVMDIELIDASVVPGYATSSKSELLEAIARVRGIAPAIGKELEAAAKQAAAKKGAVGEAPAKKSARRPPVAKKAPAKKFPAKRAAAAPRSINKDEAKAAWSLPSGSRS
ncbi:ParB/RepB/Spo0J family partition protein [Paraburkholderia sp. RL17-373-BIF-A]|uniref:ParB/RepB/Spo0J family partition protein n=1 Tax=Paraburkholderia sp. RL17-373-BIF-A TaxID=3031629 RepID=UPI0038BB2B4A